MSRLSGRLRSGGVRLTCEALADKDCSDDEGPSLWEGDEEQGGTSVGPTDSSPASSLHYSFYSPPSLANGLRNHEEQLRRRARRRRQTEYVEQVHTQEQMHIQQNTQPQIHTPQHSHSLTQSGTHLQPHTHIPMDTHMWMDTSTLTHKRTPTDTGSSLIEQDPSLIPEDLSLPSKTETHNVHVQSAPLLHTSPPPKTLSPPQYNPASLPKEETEHNSTCKPEMDRTTDPDHGQSTVMTSVEAERKYTLRSSGRPRFPCHLRKSSRLRRAAEDSMFKRELDQQDEEEEENRVWRTEEIRPMEEHPPEVCAAASSFEVLPSPTISADVTPNHSVRTSEGEGIITHHAVRGKRQGRYLGVRKIVVKVARIPVHMSRRQKSYKISSLEPASAGIHGEGVPTGEGPEAGVGGEPGANVSREPTALLRMKNNGKSVMVMFPPGELPVILKRRRGRPPKQALPGQPDMHETRVGAASAAEPKKIRRRRTVKLPSPQPSYVNDTNDVKVEYADVLSKLAFLNRQPPSTGRCSPPRCWTPTEPETFHIPPENPSLSTLLHRLTGFRRRGGRAGCMGSRGGGAAGSSDSFKRSFSDFFETIGKKRKVPASEPGTPRKRGKGVAGGINRAALADAVQGEKVRKRRSRKNGALKNCTGAQEQDWQNENSSWIGKGDRDNPEKASSYQSPCSPRGSFQSSEASKGGMYHSPGMRGVCSGEESQGMFAGYFRSLLDSDDSSDLLDISMSSPAGRQEGRKVTPGFEGGSPGAAHRWSPAFPKRSPKGAACLGEGAPLSSPQTQGSSATKPSYSYSVSQTSPTPSFPKSPALLLSRSPSSPHPSGGFPQYPPSYSAGVPQGGSIYPLPQQQQQQQQQRPSDCSFTYGTKTPSVPSAQCQMSYSNYQGSAKRSYSGYPGPPHSAIQRGDSGATSPGGSYMSVSKSSPYSLSSSPPEGCRQYTSTAQWGYRQGGNNWGSDAYGSHQFHGYSDYGVAGTGSESKDILDISNYTPQKAKQRPCPDTLSESSSDSSHTGGGGMSVVGGAFRPRDVPMPEGQSSLSSLEKLMLDWNENSAGPSYNWSQNVLFQGGAKPGRGRRKKSETHNEKEACSVPPGSPASPPMQGGPKRSATGGRQPRGARGRGGFSPCQRDRPPPPKTKSQKPSTPSGSGQMGSGGLYQETLDYYSGDSSSLSPLSHAPESCEYPSPYSVHTSTPSSDERFAHVYPPDSASVSPSLSNQSDALKQYPKPGPPSQTYGHAARTFSPTLSPTPRLLPQCGSAMSPHRVPKDQFSQYDSPSYSGSPCWYGQGGSVAGSPQNYEEQRTPAVSLPSHKRDMSLMVSGMRVPSHSSYPSPLQRGPSMSTCVSGTLDSSPQHDEMGYHGNLDSYAPVGHRYAPQTARGGVLCQLLDQPSDEGFTVTSL